MLLALPQPRSKPHERRGCWEFVPLSRQKAGESKYREKQPAAVCHRQTKVKQQIASGSTNIASGKIMSGLNDSMEKSDFERSLNRYVYRVISE